MCWWTQLEEHTQINEGPVRPGTFSGSAAKFEVILHKRMLSKLRSTQRKGAESQKSPIQRIWRYDVSNKTMSAKVYE